MDFDQIAELRNKAYAAFVSSYQVENPPPQRQLAQKENERESLVLGVLMVASVTVSGSRTITEFGGGVLGIAGLIMLEVGVIAYAYMRSAKFYTRERHQEVKNLLTTGMWLAFAVTVVTNIHATFKGAGVTIPFSEVVDVGIFLLLAVGAPTLALISGDALAMLVTTDRMRQRELDKAHEEALQLYRQAMNAQWKLDQRKWGVSVQRVQVERPEAVQLSSPSVSNGQSIGQQVLPAASTIGHKKAPNASELARQYFLANPDALEIPARDLVDVIGAGKSTINNVQNQMKNGGE